jgi:TetR/AcrR family transcriptional regulator, transcriptional repressor for nem operon
MRRSQKDTAETRANIIEAASQILRARGIEATSVADVMSAVGLTVGGFYRHFDSKDALVAEAIETASLETTARHSEKSAGREGDLVALLETYLSDAHRKNPGRGCPVATLCSEVAHGDKTTKKAFTGAMRRLFGTVDAAIGQRSEGDRGQALFLSRATHDETLACEILSAVRERLLEKRKSHRAIRGKD